MDIKCDRCGKEWDYTGSNEFFATCPDCRKLVKLKRVE